jgi:hypothetical protein
MKTDLADGQAGRALGGDGVGGGLPGVADRGGVEVGDGEDGVVL